MSDDILDVELLDDELMAAICKAWAHKDSGLVGGVWSSGMPRPCPSLQQVARTMIHWKGQIELWQGRALDANDNCLKALLELKELKDG